MSSMPSSGGTFEYRTDGDDDVLRRASSWIASSWRTSTRPRPVIARGPAVDDGAGLGQASEVARVVGLGGARPAG